MASGGMEECIGMMQVLGAAAPPEPAQVIAYSAEAGVCGKPFHDVVCPEPSMALKRAESTTGAELRQTLYGLAAWRPCSVCCKDQWNHVRLVTYSSLDPTKKSIGCWARLALYYEAWKTGNEDAWYQWAGMPENTMVWKNAREHFKWNDKAGGTWVACFEVHGTTGDNWVIGTGDHISVKRSRDRDDVVVHGILPEALNVNQHGRALSSVVVPVGTNFTRRHLELAVALYEDEMPRFETDMFRQREITGDYNHKKLVAQEVVEQAQMILG